MTDTTKLSLAFGRRTYPDNVRAVWGARLIWPNDLVPDRQDLAAHSDEAKQELIAWLDGPNRGDGAISKMRDALREPYSLGLSPMMEFEEEVTIFEDEDGKIIGSAQGSGGYVYVCGWLFEHDDERTK
jgi:hypothetical protein